MLRAGRWFGFSLWVLLSAGAASACSGHAQPGPAAEGQPPSNPLCAPDQVREYFCDDLLPLTSAVPAPAPYENCPGVLPLRPTGFKAVAALASFDPPFTEYTRRRVAPGHACCYGVCTAVTLASPSSAKPAACSDRNALPESFCMREPETGTSASAASPFDHCPAAVRPPEAGAFAVPEAALLNSTATATRRQQTRLSDCCYTWCSKAPVGTVLTQPKTR
jgi:hypothetical protein